MELKQLKATRSAKLNEAQSLIAGSGTLTPQNEVRFHTIMDEVSALDQVISKHRSERRSGLRDIGNPAGGNRPPRSQPGAEARSNDLAAQERAFRTWMRTGQLEQRDLGVGPVAGSISGGNVLVPTGFDPVLHSALKSFGQLATAVRTFRTDNGGPIKVALESDVTNGLILAPEATAVSEVDPSVSGFVSNVDSLSVGMVSVTNQLLNDSQFSVSQWLGERFGRRYATGLAQLIALGNNSNVQKLTPGAVVTSASGQTNTVTIDNLTDTFGLLDDAYLENASWVMTQSTKVDLMKLKDNYGHSLLQPDATGKPFNSIYGRPIVISPYTDQLGAGKTPILFGDLEASYTLRIVGGLEIARSTEYLFAKNETAFAGWCRVGGYNTSQSSSPSLVGFTNAAS